MVSCTLGSAVFTAFIAVLWLVSPASSAFNYDMKQKAVSQLILSKLGMTQPPDVTPEQIASVDKTVLREYRTLTGISSFTLGTEKQALSEQEYYADTVTIIDVTEWTENVCGKRILSKFYRLDVTKLPSSSADIKSATLQISCNDEATANNLLLSAYQLTAPCSPVGRILLDVKRLNTFFAVPFIQFNVTAAVRSWATDISTYHGLEVEISMGACSLVSILQTRTLQTTLFRLTDVTVTRQFGSSLFVTSQVIKEEARQKRQTLDLGYCSKLEPGHPNCCIYNYTVNFVEDLGWNWIIQPPVVQLNQCSGNCPSLWAEEGNYTQAMNDYKTLNPSGSVSPCCNPRTYKDLEILYFNRNAILVMGILKNMVVTSCVCS